MKNDMRKEAQALDMVLEMLARETKEPVLVYYNTQNKLVSKMHLIGMNMNHISSESFTELNNIVSQFDKVIDNFLKENNIELKEI